jgi:sulfoxide reductase heme-binding subunit YedZ
VKRPWLVPAVWTAGLLPLFVLLVRAATARLGANPITEALNELGLLALILLVATLACTPLRLATGAAWPIAIRKTLGLLAFVYVCLHFTTYALLDQGLDLVAIGQDIVERGFILVGFSAFVLLVPLAVTSTSAMLKRLGARRWRRLHKLAYVCASLGIVHFVWRVKKDLTEPIVYGAVLALLFAVRLWDAARKARARKAGAR